MVKKSNQLFDKATKAYTKKYFVEEKLMALWNLVAKVRDMFQTIVQQAPASKSCSK
jgi:putative heme degradation protein